jgi:hypothetical protein
MSSGSIGAVARVVGLAVLAIALWAATKYLYAKPQVLGEGAPAAAFSSGRAYAALGRVLGPEVPHPVSSDENVRVRARVMAEFARLGVKTSTYTGFACNAWRGFDVIPCATVTDIVAEVLPGEGKAIVLLAHYDSVPAGPGASDDESGTATVIETARALRARGGTSLHPVIAVITDGEEAGLLGAQAFLQNRALKARVGAVVNVEARGTRGRSLLFQTSAGDSKLIDLYAGSVPYYATSSLFAEIYKLLPNDTDLTLFIRQGFPSFNFAFSDNVADYHTPLDRRENLSKLTLQQQGDNMLGVASTLTRTPYGALKGGNAVYLDLVGYALPRIPGSWTLPLSVLALLVLLAAAWRVRGIGARDWVAAGLLPLAMLVACGAVGWVLHFIAQAISGQPDPSYAYPIAFREALTFGMIATVLLVARMAGRRAALLAVWLWFAALSLIASLAVNGLSPYFLFPAVLAALVAIWVAVRPEAVDTKLFVLPTLLALVVWIGLVATGEGLMGLKLHPLFTVPGAFAAMTLVWLLDARAMPRGAWLGTIVVFFGASLVATVIAGMQPAFSKTIAQRLNIRYVEDAARKRAWFALDANAPLPAPLRGAASFSATPEPVLPGPFPDFYRAPAGEPRLPAPGARIVADGTFPGGRRVTVALHGSAEASTMAIVIPKEAKLRALDIHGQHLEAPKGHDGFTLLACASRDCAGEVVSIETATGAAFKLHVIEQRNGLSPQAAKIAAARPPQAIPSQSGDVTLLTATLDIPRK